MVTKWNDTRIQDLNPTIANKLPGEDIRLGYSDNSELTVVEVFKRAMESFSVNFADALAAANRSLAQLPPATAVPPRAFATGASGVLRTQWLQVHTPSLEAIKQTWLDHSVTVHTRNTDNQESIWVSQNTELTDVL